MSMLRFLFRNPFTLYLKYTFNCYRLQKMYKDSQLEIGYMCNIIGCKFGFSNTIYDNATLIKTVLGDYTYVGSSTRISNTTIGKFCSIGPDVIICPGKHPTKTFVSTHPSFYSVNRQVRDYFCDKNYFEESSPVSIGNDVWIGARVIIVDGVNIGDGAIIATGAIVTKDVPPYAIIAGMPAKVIKYRFEDSEIEFLTIVKWWDRDRKWLKDNFKLFFNIKDFVIKFNS